MIHYILTNQMLTSALHQIVNFNYPNLIYTLADNSLYLGVLFGACGILGELQTNEKIDGCLRTNLKVASNFILIGSILNLYRINRI